MVADTLKPLGFTAITGTSFTRQVGQQLHFVGLQYRQFSSEITFNLGCHFEGIPSLCDFRSITTANLADLDCGLRTRVGNYIRGGDFDVWWAPDKSEVPAALAEACWAIERGFDDCMRTWGSDGNLILQSHIKTRTGKLRISRTLFRWMLPQAEFHRFAFVALLAHRHGNHGLAAELCDKAFSFGQFQCDFGLLLNHLE